VTLSLKEAGLQKSVLTNRNLIQRLVELVKQAHHCKAQRIPKGSIGRSSRYRRKEFALTWGDPYPRSWTRKSAEVI